MRALTLLVALSLLLFSLTGCEVEQTREGEMPELEGGQVPAYEIEPGTIQTGTETQTVTVPEGIETGTRAVETPTLDIETPPDGQQQ